MSNLVTTTPVTPQMPNDQGVVWKGKKSRSLPNMIRSGLAVLRARWHLRHVSQLGPRVRVWGKPSVYNWGEMIIGDRVRLFAKITPTELVANKYGRLEIGAGTFINHGCSIAAMQSVTIGPRCNIGTYVNIMDNQFHRVEPELRHEIPESAPVVIGENVWLGTRVVVLPGVTIGADSVIGAGSVVTRDIPPRSVAAGMPAKVIRTL